MVAVTSDSLYTGNPLNIFKGQKGLVLIRDYDPTRISANFTPFDSATGLFDGTLKTTGGYQCLGAFDENGIEFDPSISVADTKIWQSPDKQRSDVTERGLTGAFTCVEQRPIIDAINNLLPLSAAGSIGQAGYVVKPDSSPTIYERDALFIGVDTKYGVTNRVAWFARCEMNKPDKYSWVRKTETQSKLVLEALFEPTIGAPYELFVDGPGWRASGGVTGVPGGVVAPVATAGGTAGTATLTFAVPATANGPFTYSVFQDNGSAGTWATQLSSSQVVASTVGSTVTLTLTGITPTGAHTFKVSAIGSNLSTSAKSLASNSVTTT